MKLILCLILLLSIACQKQETSTASTQVSSTVQSDDLFQEDKEGCADSEMTEDKIVQQAMATPAAEGGALKGATDCEIQ